MVLLGLGRLFLFLIDGLADGAFDANAGTDRTYCKVDDSHKLQYRHMHHPQMIEANQKQRPTLRELVAVKAQRRVLPISGH